MCKWQKQDCSGISIGGEFYQADERGVVEIPDNWNIAEHGFTVFFEEEKKVSKSKKAE